MSTATSTVGPYRIDGLVGRGGMGEVFRAFDTRRQRTVALKLLPAALSSDPEYRERFRRESLAAAALVSPHVVPIHDFGEVEGRLFIDMRLIEGADLSRHLDGQPMEVDRAVDIVLQVCDALGDAHDHGVVHRDVKPSNILLTETGFAYLVDFGIATTGAADTALTATGSTIGTFGYMAPERFDGTPADPRADIYSLGCVLHELLAGVRPFSEHQSTPSLIRAHLMLEPTPPSSVAAPVPAEIDRIVLTAMAKDPAQRYPSTHLLAQALREATGRSSPRPVAGGDVTSFAASAPISARSYTETRIESAAEAVPAAVQARRPGRGARIAVGAGLAAFLLAGGVAAGSWLTAEGDQRTTGTTSADSVAAAPLLTAPAPRPGSLLPLATPRTAAAPVEWTLEATSSKDRGTITWNNGQGGIEQEPSLPLPWSKKVTVEPGRLGGMNFSVGNVLVIGDREGATVRCRLLRDGRVVDEQTSKGMGAIASCKSF